MNSGTEPVTGILRSERTTISSDSAAAITITRPLAQIFDMAISKGETGMTSR